MQPIATDVARSVVRVSVYFVHTDELCKNCWTMEMPFEGQTDVGPRNLVLDHYMEVQILPPKWTFLRGHVPARSNVPTTYAWVHSALFFCRLWRMCLPSARGRRMHSRPQGLTARRCGLLPNYFVYFLLFYVVVVSLRDSLTYFSKHQAYE